MPIPYKIAEYNALNDRGLVLCPVFLFDIILIIGKTHATHQCITRHTIYADLRLSGTNKPKAIKQMNDIKIISLCNHSNM